MAEIISGMHTVLELLRAGKRRCHEVYIVEGKKERIVSQIEETAKKAKARVKHVTPEEIAALSPIDKHQGIAAKCDPFVFASTGDLLNEAKVKGEKGFIVILDGVMDPQNLGSLIRTAHLCGAHGMILPKDNSAPLSPAAMKASSGACEYLSIVQITNVVSTMKDLKDSGYWLAGAAGGTAQNVYLFDFTSDNYVLILGAEGKGLRRLVKENCDFLLSIPMYGRIDSFNVSAAGAIFMSEMMRQRHFKTP